MTTLTEWIASQKFYLTPVLSLAGAGALLWAFQFEPVPEAALTKATYDAHYVGPVDLQRSSGGIIHAGYGIGWRTSAPLIRGRALGNESYARFSHALSLTEEDIERVRAAGRPYEVGMHQGVIMTIAGARGSVISYEDYSARALARRNQLLATGGVLLVLAAVTYFVRSEARRSK